jgi:hypothetical protein
VLEEGRARRGGLEELAFLRLSRKDQFYGFASSAVSENTAEEP